MLVQKTKQCQQNLKKIYKQEVEGGGIHSKLNSDKL